MKSLKPLTPTYNYIMKIISDFNPNVFVDSLLVDQALAANRVPLMHVMVVLMKFAQDGGTGGDFSVYAGWGGYPGLTFKNEIKGKAWALQIRFTDSHGPQNPPPQ